MNSNTDQQEDRLYCEGDLLLYRTSLLQWQLVHFVKYGQPGPNGKEWCWVRTMPNEGAVLKDVDVCRLSSEIPEHIRAERAKLDVAHANLSALAKKYIESGGSF